jgi:hypothetical protein
MRWIPKDKFNPYTWHRWFAWFPVTTKQGTRVWLEVVWRMRIAHYSDWYEYAEGDLRLNVVSNLNKG